MLYDNSADTENNLEHEYGISKATWTFNRRDHKEYEKPFAKATRVYYRKQTHYDHNTNAVTIP